VKVILALFAVASLAVGVAAQTLPKLPDALMLAKAADSPGQVIFNHASHVDAAKPACTACHPKEFRILKGSAPATPIKHADMEKGRQCGKCHDGKTSFGMTDDCTLCHQS
jgi:c(7)-type cytochrome triheme protein